MNYKNTADLNSKISILVITTLCSIPFVIIIMVPVLVSGIVESYNVSPQKAGFIASADMAGYTLGTFLSFLIMRKLSWRSLCTKALLLMALANGLSIICNDYYLIMAARLLSGLGAGTVTAILLATIGKMHDSDSAYGWWLVAQSIISGMCFYLFPSINQHYGIDGIFLLFSLLCITGLLFMGYVPSNRSQQATPHAPSKKAGNYKIAAWGMLALFLFECGLMAPYTYAELLGRAGGLSIDKTSLSLSLSMIGGILGGLIAAKLSTRYGRMLPILLGNAVLIISLLMLKLEQQTFYNYATAIFLLFGVWNCVLPYLLGILSDSDPSGSSLALGNGAIGIALVTGPFIAALLVGNNVNQQLTSQSYHPVLFFGMALLTAATICISPALYQFKKIYQSPLVR
ncbi:MFS transporter [Dasania sp. GY-MA-18]|uniref:MFS transporter n=1 Tax=Dasania phycosphaerae TaxID=2950436 RepID=A0A9J6RM34_9GAMM|nr:MULTISPECIES: MFS transporter [Dasania]MCR8923147.1 MFS transporter [Dasania sp. GY-MA-18]MCZ0865579.1 MFS transporter [Dasania phycosphaerae]MCZ0869304.1 MFS transporter [Dasania phycosphaerae]